MKSLYVLLVTLFIFTYSNAQIVDIPDENFKNVLLNYNPVIDINDDGEIQVSEAELVTSLALVNLGIMSLEGISSFTNIIDIFIESNPLVSLDFSQNNNLEVIHCSFNELVSLNVPQNNNLEVIRCSNNQLVSLNVSNNPNLRELDCYNNLITSIDVSQNLNLLELWCGGNNLLSLDLENNVNLEKLSFWDNEISEIDVSENTNITLLSFESTNINNIDISQNVNLEILYCGINELSDLNVSQNLNLKVLAIENNLLTNLDISQNLLLEKLWCYQNEFLQNLNIANGNNSNLTNFNATENPNLICIQVDDEDYANIQDCNLDPPYNGWCKDDSASYSEKCILGIEDNAFINFAIYPIPTQGVLNIESQRPIETVKIYNLQGQLIKEDSNRSVDVSQLTTGLYFVHVIVDGKTVTKKFIKE